MGDLVSQSKGARDDIMARASGQGEKMRTCVDAPLKVSRGKYTFVFFCGEKYGTKM